jgi:hypothetical protein
VRHDGRLYTFTLHIIINFGGQRAHLDKDISLVVRDGGVYRGHCLFVCHGIAGGDGLDGVDGLDGIDGVDGHVLGHVRVCVGDDVYGRKRRFLFRNDVLLMKGPSELIDGLPGLGEFDQLETPRDADA